MSRDIEGSVSRETLDDLRRFAELLEKWNKRINLVSRNTIPQLWERHILDSLQLWPLLPQGTHAVDFGTGGGFPGLILAIANHREPKIDHFSFLESDRRKSAFLIAMIAEFHLNAKAVPKRIEEAPPQAADVVTARALAPLSDLLGFCDRHLLPNGKALFLKGATAQQEIADATPHWRFSLTPHTSKTDENATILEVGELSRA